MTLPSGNRYHQQAERIEGLTHCDSIPPSGLERHGKSLQVKRIELLDSTRLDSYALSSSICLVAMPTGRSTRIPAQASRVVSRSP